METKELCMITGCKRRRYGAELCCLDHSAQSFIERALSRQPQEIASRIVYLAVTHNCRTRGCGSVADGADGLCVRCREEREAIEQQGELDWPPGLWRLYRRVLLALVVLFLLMHVGVWLGWLPKGAF